MKKILFVMHTLGFGGAERALVNLLCELPRDRFEVDVLLFQRTGALMAQLPSWVRVLETPEVLKCLYGSFKKAGRYALPKLMGKGLAMLARRTRKAQAGWRWTHVYGKLIPKLHGHYDAAVAFSGSEIQYFVADCVDADKKIVFVHNDYRTAKYSAEFDEASFGKMDAIVSISRRCVETLEEVFPQYRARMLYLENITSSKVIKTRAGEFEPPEFTDVQVNILSVGRLWPQKGFDMAIDAAALLKKEGVSFRWFVLGEGDLRQPLQQQIDALGLTEDFFLLGARENPYPYMRRCDVLVQSSRYEGKSVVLDEAKMLCTPIVATAYPTVADQVADGREGLVVPMSAEGIAEGVRRMLRDDALRNEITTYLADHEYGNQAEVDKYIKLLDV